MGVDSGVAPPPTSYQGDDYPSYYFAAPRAEMLQLLPAGSHRVLEVGCGSGAFRRHFSPDVEYWGIEPAPGPATEAERHLSRVLRGCFDDCMPDLPERYFDLVVCNDVIEHMPDHSRFLATIKNVLAPGGALVRSVPNVRVLSNLARLIFKRDWAYVDSGTLDRTHLRFFTRKSLLRELESHGYTVDRFIGLNRLGYLDQAAVRLIKYAVTRAAALLLGSDVAFVQFGFRATLRSTK